MKTFVENLCEVCIAIDVKLNEQKWERLAKEISRIQLDAKISGMEEAAKICLAHGEKYNGSQEGMGGGWTALTTSECAAAILSAIAELEKPTT